MSDDIKKISEEDRQKILDKIEIEYHKYAGIYGKRVFDINKFYHRYNRAIALGYNEENFLFAEIQATIDFHSNHNKNQQSTLSGKTIVGIYNEFEERVSKYSKVDISPKAEEEIERLLGALREFEVNFFPFLYEINKKIKSLKFKRDFEKIEYQFHQLVGGSSFSLPQEFLLYQNKLNSLKSREDIQKEGHVVLKKVFEFLIAIRDFLMSINNKEESVNNSCFLNGTKEQTFLEVYNLIIEQINLMLFDFRLKGLLGE